MQLASNRPEVERWKVHAGVEMITHRIRSDGDKGGRLVYKVKVQAVDAGVTLEKNEALSRNGGRFCYNENGNLNYKIFEERRIFPFFSHPLQQRSLYRIWSEGQLQ